METDSDGDLVPDCSAQCLLDPNKSVPGSCGGEEAEIESDSDGLPDRIDECLQDHEKYLRCVRGQNMVQNEVSTIY